MFLKKKEEEEVPSRKREFKMASFFKDSRNKTTFPINYSLLDDLATPSYVKLRRFGR